MLRTEVEVDVAACDRVDKQVRGTYRTSVKPSARSSSSAMYSGARQMFGIPVQRIVVISGGASSASDARAPRSPRPPPTRLARKSRRDWMIRINASSVQFRTGAPPPALAHAFSSRLSSLRKRQSVPSAMSGFGLDLIMPTSCSRSA